MCSKSRICKTVNVVKTLRKELKLSFHLVSEKQKLLEREEKEEAEKWKTFEWVRKTNSRATVGLSV